MATFTTYDKTAGNLERSVEDVIYNISPEETPAFTIAKKTVADATLHEWQEDELAAADPDNAARQGADAEFENPTDVVMRNNRTQIFQKTAAVSGTLEAVKKHGIASQMAYQVSMRGRELKRDIEAAMVGRDQAAVVGSTSASAKMASVINQIDSDTTVSVTGGALTEQGVLDAHEAVFTAGGNATVMLTAPAHAQTIAGFAAASGRNRDVEQKELINAIDLYVSPFGELQVSLDRFQSADDVLLVDPEYLGVAVLRPLVTKRLAETGDAEKVQILTELTGCVLNSKAHGRVTIGE